MLGFAEYGYFQNYAKESQKTIDLSLDIKFVGWVKAWKTSDLGRADGQ